MKRVFIFLCLIIPYIGLSQNKSFYNSEASLGINFGANFSQLKIDSINNNGVMLAFMGLNFNYDISEKFGVLLGSQYSFRGSNTTNPVYKYRNEYLDIQLLGQYQLSEKLKLEFGIQRAVFMTSYYKFPTSNQITIPTYGFGSHNEFIAGLELKVYNNTYLSGRYTMPTKDLEYSNIQFSLNFKLHPWKKKAKLNSFYDIKSASENPLLVEKLVLHRKDLTEFPAEIIQMKNLEELILDANEIKTIPPEIGELVNLSRISLKFNDLDSLPKEIGKLKNLKELSLEHNKLKQIPKEIGNLENMEFLYIGKNELKYLPPEIGKLIHLKELNISKSGVMLVIPAEYKNLKQLDILIIDHSTQTSFNLKLINANLRIIVR